MAQPAGARRRGEYDDRDVARRYVEEYQKAWLKARPR